MEFLITFFEQNYGIKISLEKGFFDVFQLLQRLVKQTDLKILQTFKNKIKKMDLLEQTRFFVQLLEFSGLYLNHIDPLYLIPFPIFISTLRSQVSEYVFQQHKHFENESFYSTQYFAHLTSLFHESALAYHENVFTESWTFILFQFVKIFIIPTLNFHQIFAMKNLQILLERISNIVPESIFQEINRSSKFLHQSPILNFEECMLLKLLTIHYNSCNLQNPRILTDFLEVENEVVSQSVLSFLKLSDTSVAEYLKRKNINPPGNAVRLFQLFTLLYQKKPGSTSINFHNSSNDLRRKKYD